MLVFTSLVYAIINNIHNFQALIYFHLGIVALFFHSLVVTALGIEIQDNPSKFLFRHGLCQCFLAKIVNTPVMRNQLAISNQARLMSCKVIYHLIERRHESKLKLSVCVFTVCNKRDTIVLEFSRMLFKINLLLILSREETKNPQHAMQTLTAQLAPLVKPACAPKATTLCHLCLEGSFLVVGEHICTHGNNPASQCNNLLCSIIHNCPSYTVGS